MFNLVEMKYILRNIESEMSDMIGSELVQQHEIYEKRDYYEPKWCTSKYFLEINRIIQHMNKIKN